MFGVRRLHQTKKATSGWLFLWACAQQKSEPQSYALPGSIELPGAIQPRAADPKGEGQEARSTPAVGHSN